jgi:AraC-like DNA-binding protein
VQVGDVDESALPQVVQYRPPAPLSACVDLFWYRCGRVADSRRQLALPTGSVDVTFNLHEDSLRVFADAEDRRGQAVRDAIVHGAQSRYFVLDARRDVHVVGIHFRPGGAGLLGIPAPELADQHVALEDLWGTHARTVREQLLAAPTPQAKFAVLERELLARMSIRPLVNPAISFALRGIQTSPTDVRIAALHGATGYSARRFTTLFTTAVGLTPKLYSRICRLRAVVEQIARCEPDWAQVASEFGYYDQSHLIHDFRQLSGVTPADYRPVSPARALHMEIDGPSGAK